MKILHITGMVVIFTLVLFSLACLSRTSPVPPPALAPDSITEGTKPAWELEMKRLVDVAKKEGRVVVIGGAVGSDVRVGITSAFKNIFGLETEFLSGRGAEQTEKLLRERRAGIFSSDVYVGGATTPTMQLKPEGVLAPILFS